MSKVKTMSRRSLENLRPQRAGEPSHNKTGNNGRMEERGKFQEMYDEYGEPFIMATMRDPHGKAALKWEMTQWLGEMGYGKPTQRQEHTGANGADLIRPGTPGAFVILGSPAE